MTKLTRTSAFYGILGLVLGVYYRELTKMNDFTGTTQLGTSHTHAFALGMLVFLIVLLLEANFKLSEQGKTYRLFYILQSPSICLNLALRCLLSTA